MLSLNVGTAVEYLMLEVDIIYLRLLEGWYVCSKCLNLLSLANTKSLSWSSQLSICYESINERYIYYWFLNVSIISNSLSIDLASSSNSYLRS
jgi:hypothetical protein